MRHHWERRWKVGELALFEKRLVTVKTIDADEFPRTVEFVDDGGIAHTCTVKRPATIKPRPRDGETILDVIVELSRARLLKSERRARRAEVWLADPQVGDVFKRGPGHFLKIAVIYDDGRILCKRKVFYHRGRDYTEKSMVFASPSTLRESLMLGCYPGYTVTAYRSKRSRGSADPQEGASSLGEIARYTSVTKE